MRTVAVVEAKSQFSALLAAVENGEEVAITRRGRVIARLESLSASSIMLSPVVENWLAQ